MKLAKLVTAVAAGMLAAQSVLAHVPYVEDEMVRRKGATLPGEDYSFETPGHIELDIQESQAWFSYLDWGDVDVYEFTVAPGDIGFNPVTGQPQPLVSASALPPACKQNKYDYPVTALIGPAGSGTPLDVEVPGGIPEGYSVIAYADNPFVGWGEDRPVFASPEFDYAWFLPQGLTQHCLQNAPFLCDFSNTVSTPVFVPGKYYIAVWNPYGWPMDFTANIGFQENLLSEDSPNYSEAAAIRADVVVEVTDNYKLNHRRCTPQ